jgi:hypothetical protein
MPAGPFARRNPSSSLSERDLNGTVTSRCNVWPHAGHVLK